MNSEQIKDIQRRIGAAQDGWWGPISIMLCQRHLRTKMELSKNVWPKSDQESLTAFYGKPGDESRHTKIDVSGLGVCYEGVLKKTMTCHVKVADSLKRIVEKLATMPEGKHILARYDGCYNNRPMRGGTKPSLHARAAAVDFDADNNGNLVHWPAVATMPFSVMEVFADEGWLSLGAFIGRDSMHFQCTK
jgi:hypothetical protein